jgi:Fur family transcriptional regulator, ferric uptake regulator
MTSDIEQKFEAHLRSVRMKRSGRRLTILRVFLACTKPVTGMDLLYAVKREDMAVSISVVYSTLRLLVACGLAREIQDKRKILYMPEAAQCSHQHLICKDCGAVIER